MTINLHVPEATVRIVSQLSKEPTQYSITKDDGSFYPSEELFKKILWLKR